MSRWQDGAFVAAVKHAAVLGLSQRAIAARLRTSERQVWQALNGRVVGAPLVKPVRCCSCCQQPLGEDARPQARRHPACVEALERRKAAERVTVDRRKPGRVPAPPDLPAAEIEARLAAALARVRRTHRFTVNAWAQKEPMEWDT